MEQKTMRIGEIYGLWDNEGGYHPYLIIAITRKRTYFLQGSSIKLKPTAYYHFEETNIFEEQDSGFYVVQDYNFDQSLQYKTAFSVERFNFSKEKEEQVKKKQKLIGIVSENDYENIKLILLKIDWQNTAYISDKHFKDILQKTVYMEEWNWH